jgi:poly(ribitol-phosphate) beta-N-acetylglucosaminyltransferase
VTVDPETGGPAGGSGGPAGGSGDPTGGGPDVSVVVPIYNTMPYLTRCLRSLVGQSIGPTRLEIIGVDDGSTDGSGRELDRFADRYPDLVTAVHQANSGGPAGPCNRGLDRATGRYVFFVGADDYLGHQALGRLVTAADAYGSDVVLGRAVGVNSRAVDQQIFVRSAIEVDLFDSALPYALANTKLFRRALIERYRLRYPEDMPIASDQPFTLAACYRARRISVLADYDFYFAVRRLNSHNLTYRSRVADRLRCVEQLMTRVADLLEPGPKRDAILVRHFNWELAKLVEDDFLALDPPTQERIAAGVAKLAEQYLTDRIRARLALESRLRLAAAQHGGLDGLVEVIRQDADRGVPPTIVDGGRWFAGYRSQQANGSVSPQPWQDVTDAAAHWLARLDVTQIRWESVGGARCLTVTARSPWPDLAQRSTSPIRMLAGAVAGTTQVRPAAGDGTTLRARFRLADLLVDTASSGWRRPLQAEVGGPGGPGTSRLRGPGLRLPRPVVCRYGLRPVVVAATRDRSGHLMIAMVPVTVGQVTARLRGRLRRGGTK